MIDTILGLPNYFGTVYFAVTAIVSVVLAVYFACKMDDEEEGKYDR